MNRRAILRVAAMTTASLAAGCGSDLTKSAPAHLDLIEAFARITLPEMGAENIPFEEAVSDLFHRCNELNTSLVTFVPDFSQLPDEKLDQPVTFHYSHLSALEVLMELCALVDATFRLHNGTFQFGTAEDAYFQDPSWEPMGALLKR
ncbi:hypothetical protein BH23VER1_BH23VER1_30450 [soil metagenome]